MGRKFNYESNGSFGSENGAKTKKLWPKRCWLQCQATVTVSGSRVRVAMNSTSSPLNSDFHHFLRISLVSHPIWAILEARVLFS